MERRDEPARPPGPFEPTAAEWSALFPAPPGARDESRLEPGGPYPARDPLTRSALFAALRGQRLAAFVSRGQLLLGPAAAHQGRNASAPALLSVALLGPLWVFNGASTLFPRAQLAVATAVNAAWVAFVLASSWAAELGVRGHTSSNRSAFMAADMSATPYAGVARWWAVAPPGASELTRHTPGDRLCPCCACVGAVPDGAAAEVLAWTVFSMALLSFLQTAMVWTPIVTFAARTWSTPWSAFLAAAFLVTKEAYHLVQHLPYNALSHPPLEIPKRLRHRAVLLTLRDLVSRLELEAASAKAQSCCCAGDPPTPISAEPYVALHAELLRSWDAQIRGAFLSHGLLLTWGLFTVVLGVIFASAGSCIPVWIPLYLLEIVLILLRNLLLTAALNSGVASVRSLLSDASKSLLRLPTPAARRHAELLRAYAADDPRGRWLGVPVGYGFARTAAASLFTLALGAWTVARGFGVAIVLESACGGMPVG